MSSQKNLPEKQQLLEQLHLSLERAQAHENEIERLKSLLEQEENLIDLLMSLLWQMNEPEWSGFEAGQAFGAWSLDEGENWAIRFK